MKRYGSVIQLKEDQAELYVKEHANTWPEVLAQNTDSGIRNYSIYMRRLPDGNLYLFSYFEYVGSDFEADMAKMAANPKLQEWWDLCKPCHEPFADREEGEWWASMEEVFHQD